MLICCIKENPEPIIFKIACDGVKPEIQLDTKMVNFEKVLLQRKDSKTIYMRNQTLLPVFWKVSGVDVLGEDFTVSHDQGTIEPKSEFALQIHFRAMKPYKSNQKKGIRIEVFDIDQIMGLLQTENIAVLAEAYDVALDMSYQKGESGGLDFGSVKVFDETKQQLVLRNKGPYEIDYRFACVFFHSAFSLSEFLVGIAEVNFAHFISILRIEMDNSASKINNVSNYFLVVPNKGQLSANDRPANITVQITTIVQFFKLNTFDNRNKHNFL